MIGHVHDPVLLDHLPSLVTVVPVAVAEACALNPNPNLAETCVLCLEDQASFLFAREALTQMGIVAVGELKKAAQKEGPSTQAIAILGEMKEPEARDLLFELLMDENDEIRYRAEKALSGN